MEKPVFKIYKQGFVCDKCGELTCMGIVDYSAKYLNICDLCLVNEMDKEEISHFENSKLRKKIFALVANFQQRVYKKIKPKI